jgi:hypothetical protein
VPVVQANFILGVDEERGDEPVGSRASSSGRRPWPNVDPFGGTPLYDAHRREGRIVETMPFASTTRPIW